MVRWVELADTAKTFEGLKDLLLREQFINASQSDLALFIKERKPTTIRQMADLAEHFLEAHDYQFMHNDKFSSQGKKPGY